MLVHRLNVKHSRPNGNVVRALNVIHIIHTRMRERMHKWIHKNGRGGGLEIPQKGHC